VATVGDMPILRGDVDQVVRRALRTAAAGNAAETPRHLEAAALEQLIDERLLRTEIVRARIPITDAEIDDGVARLRQQATARGQDWNGFLERAGLDEAVVREQVSLEVGLDKLVRAQLREDRITATFERHRRALDGTRLRVSHIVLRPDLGRGGEAVLETVARGEEIRAEMLQTGGSFAEAARRYSTGPSRFNGGDLGWITRQGPAVEEFSRRAYELAKGDISRPFLTPFGVHLVQVTAIEPGKLGPGEVRPQLLRLLAADVVKETVARARAATRITYAEGVARFDPATPAGGAQPRRVIVEGGVVADPGDQ
jgi:parvulin-like peptidyl-prolyl isomerase